MVTRLGPQIDWKVILVMESKCFRNLQENIVMKHGLSQIPPPMLKRYCYISAQFSVFKQRAIRQTTSTGSNQTDILNLQVQYLCRRSGSKGQARD